MINLPYPKLTLFEPYVRHEVRKHEWPMPSWRRRQHHINRYKGCLYDTPVEERGM